jgi:hypothetical protein
MAATIRAMMGKFAITMPVTVSLLVVPRRRRPQPASDVLRLPGGILLPVGKASAEPLNVISRG